MVARPTEEVVVFLHVGKVSEAALDGGLQGPDGELGVARLVGVGTVGLAIRFWCTTRDGREPRKARPPQ